MPFLHSQRMARANSTAAGAIFVVLVSCGHPSGTAPSQLDHFPSDLSNPQVDASGIYADGWIMPARASANLAVQPVAAIRRRPFAEPFPKSGIRRSKPT